MKNARFWHWHRDGWVKLTLRPGQTIEHRMGGSTDEGWSHTSHRWTLAHDWAEFPVPVVRCEALTESCDCDGRLDQGGCWVCPLDELQARDMADPEEAGYWQGGELVTDPINQGILAPRWHREESWQRDYAAEAMGY